MNIDKLKQVLIVFCVLFSTIGYTQSDVRVEAVNGKAGQETLYKVNFSLPDALPANGAIHITFPETCDLSQAKIAASDSIKGGFKTYTFGQTLLLLRKGFGKEHLAGETVNVKIATIGNPANVQGSEQLEIAIYGDGQDVLRRMQQQNFSITPEKRVVAGRIALSEN